MADILNPVWVNELYIGTGTTGTGNSATVVYSKLCKGIESMEFNANEQSKQFFFLCGEGFAHNETTGAAPELTVSGRRIVGDAAQDFLVEKQFDLGPDRIVPVKIIAEGKQIVCDAAVANLKSFGGQTLDVNAFGCSLRFNGKPTVTTVTP